MENTQVKSSSNTSRLVTTAVMLAVATVLSFVKIWQMPLGGSVTLLSMLPICLLSIKYGAKWGVFSALTYAFIQMAVDMPKLMGYGMTLKIWIGCIVFDYLVAFTSLGLAGIFRNAKNGMYIGISLAMCIRLASHIISGSIFFDIWCPEGWNVFLYSIAYNGLFMLPELILTIIGAAVLFKLPQFKKMLI